MSHPLQTPEIVLHIASFCDIKSCHAMTITSSVLWNFRKELLFSKIYSFLLNESIWGKKDIVDAATKEAIKPYEIINRHLTFQDKQYSELSSLCRWLACFYGTGFIPKLCKADEHPLGRKSAIVKLSLLLNFYIKQGISFSEHIHEYLNSDYCIFEKYTHRILDVYDTISELVHMYNDECHHPTQGLSVGRINSRKGLFDHRRVCLGGDSVMSNGLRIYLFECDLIVFDQINDCFVIRLFTIRAMKARYPSQFKNLRTIKFLNCEGEIYLDQKCEARNSSFDYNDDEDVGILKVINCPNIRLILPKGSSQESRLINNEEIRF